MSILFSRVLVFCSSFWVTVSCPLSSSTMALSSLSSAETSSWVETAAAAAAPVLWLSVTPFPPKPGRCWFTTEHQDSAEQNAHRELHSPKWLQNILRMDSSWVFFTPCKAILLHLFFKQRTQMVCSTHALKKGSFVCIVFFFLLTHLNEESVDTQAGSQSEQPVLYKQVVRWKPLKN